jgi:nucleoside phosphorylase
MGCGNLVIKCAENRDRIAKRKNVIAFEMESAGVFQTFAGVVVKGVCDYADSHKNKNWQFHAAATAAAATAAMLEQFTPSDRFQVAESSSSELHHRDPEAAALTQ